MRHSIFYHIAKLVKNLRASDQQTKIESVSRKSTCRVRVPSKAIEPLFSASYFASPKKDFT